MKRRTLLVLVASVALTGQTSRPALAGSLYRNAASGNIANAIAGALVYAHRADDSSAAWIGPSLTDAYGRFSFPALDAGPYLLRVFVGKQVVWQQLVTAPAILRPIVIPASNSK
jgi:hypothetical protein